MGGAYSKWWQQPHLPAVLALLLGICVWLWAATQAFPSLDDPALARIQLGQGATQQNFARDAAGQWRVASFDDVPADTKALVHLLAQGLRGEPGAGQVALITFGTDGRVLAQGHVGAAQARALLRHPYAPRLAQLPPLPSHQAAQAWRMGDDGPERPLAAGDIRTIVNIINYLKPKAVQPGSRVAWRELVMVELRLRDGGRLYVQATHDGAHLWIRFTGNAQPKRQAAGGGLAGSFNDFRNFAYAIDARRWPQGLMPSRPKCDPTLSPTPCPRLVP